MFCPYSAFICFALFSGISSDYFPTLVFVTEIENIYSAVQTESLYLTLILKGLTTLKIYIKNQSARFPAKLSTSVTSLLLTRIIFSYVQEQAFKFGFVP
jgi:hypothetical protein